MDEQIKAALDKLAEQTKGAIEKYEGQLKDVGTASTEAKNEVKGLSEEFAALNRTVTELAQKQTAAPAKETPKSAAEEFVASEGFKQLAAGTREKFRMEVKNTVLSNSTTAFTMQRPGVISGDFKPLTIREIFPVIPVSTNSIKTLRENSWTNDAAEVSQGSAKPESDIDFNEYDVTIQTVAHHIKVSNQLLADAPAMVAYIETRLRDGLAQRIDAQLLNGNGTSPNLSGLTDSGNFVAYTATSDDNLADAINRAKYILWAKGYMPDVVIVNPADWGALERLRESAGSGTYLYGAPGTLAGMNPFGVRIVMSNNMVAGSFWIGNVAQAATLYNRSGAVIEMGYVNDDFTKNLVTIRAEERLALGVDKPSATLYGAFTA